MNGRFCLLILIATLNPLGLKSQGIDDVIKALETAGNYRAKATYEVVMPAFSKPIVYDIELSSSTTGDSDTLAPCDYLIDWEVPTVSGGSKGFSAYSAGSHYRYRDNRLQEYHRDWDSIPFGLGMARGPQSIRKGVQNNAQFTDILPQYIADQLKSIKSDSTYSYRFTPDSIINGTHLSVINALQRYKGYDSKEVTYFLEPESRLPVRIEIENNPGSIGEQAVTVNYSKLAPGPTDFSEKGLMALYPEAFGKYRLSYFKVENLPGTQLPGFSTPTPTGERYSRATGDRFNVPTLLVFLDPKVGSATETIDLVRKGIDSLPMSADVLWVFTGNNIDEIESVITRPRPGEHMLMSARALARDCGVTTFPIMLFCNRGGLITGVEIGFNKNLTTDVIQKTVIADKEK